MADYNNGSVSVTVTGGQAPYTYNLQELIGSNYVTVPDNEYTSPAWDNPVTVSSSSYTFGNSAGPDQNTTINETGVRPGTYRVRITDAGGCEIFTDPIVVNEYTITGGDACVTFETLTPPLAPLSWTTSASAPTTAANTNGNITAYIPVSAYNGGFTGNEITVTATAAGGASFNLAYNGGQGVQNSYLFLDLNQSLTPGSYTVVATVPSEGCSRSLGTTVIPPFAQQIIDVTGLTITANGSSVSPSNLVVGTSYQVTVNSTSSNLDGQAQFNLSVTGTTNFTVSPSGYSTNNTFTLIINDAGSFNLGVLAVDSADSDPVDVFDLAVTVSSGGSVPVFGCADAGFNMPNSTSNQIGQPSINFATTQLGVILNVSPSLIQAGNITYTATIQAPLGGYQNSSQSITCTDTSNGTTSGGGGTGTTVYYFHGGATNVGWPHTVGGAMTDANATYYTQSNTTGSATLSDAMTFVLDNYGNGANAVPDFLGGGSGYFIRSVEFAAGTTLLNDGNAGTSTQLTFDAIDNGDYCYIAVPQVTGFTDDLAANPGNILYAGNALSGANAIQKKAFTWNGQQYMLFSINALGTPATQQSITIDN